MRHCSQNCSKQLLASSSPSFHVAFTGQIFMKFDMSIFLKSLLKIQVT